MKLHFAQHQFVVSMLNFQGVNRWRTKSLKTDHMKYIELHLQKQKTTDDWNPKRNEAFFVRFVWKQQHELGQKKHYSSDLEGFFGTMNA